MGPRSLHPPLAASKEEENISPPVVVPGPDRRRPLIGGEHFSFCGGTSLQRGGEPFSSSQPLPLGTILCNVFFCIYLYPLYIYIYPYIYTHIYIYTYIYFHIYFILLKVSEVLFHSNLFYSILCVLCVSSVCVFPGLS